MTMIWLPWSLQLFLRPSFPAPPVFQWMCLHVLCFDQSQAQKTKMTESLLAPLTAPDSGSFRDRTSSATFYMSPQHEQYHEGFLYKRGGLRKNWKMRWFVLNGEGMEVSCGLVSVYIVAVITNTHTLWYVVKQQTWCIPPCLQKNLLFWTKRWQGERTNLFSLSQIPRLLMSRFHPFSSVSFMEKLKKLCSRKR